MSTWRPAWFGRTNLEGVEGGRESREARRRWLFVLALLVAAAVMAVVVSWSSVTAQVRAVIVLSSVLKTPVLTPAIEVFTWEPSVEDTVFAGRPTLVTKPEGEGPWPAILFVNGTIPEGREYPEVQNLARGLA
ncbi:MAG: hypothetical protein M3122_00020, partial [Actinomycetota bacterium]|nr:hypothetical protein [Actinomycetota bacterium]